MIGNHKEISFKAQFPLCLRSRFANSQLKRSLLVFHCIFFGPYLTLSKIASMGTAVRRKWRTSGPFRTGSRLPNIVLGHIWLLRTQLFKPRIIAPKKGKFLQITN